MAYIESHRPGTFCWIELATTDQEAAKRFYAGLFGWSSVDFPMGPAGNYTVFLLDGKDTAGGYTLRPDQQGVPPHWMVFIAVESADETASRTAAAGGKVLMPAIDVTTIGRMAVLQDPTGAMFSVWQPKSHKGIGIAAVDGTLCWADLMTPDPERAAKFYADVFGWELSPNDPTGYLLIRNGEQSIGGIPPAERRNPNAPPSWLLYFLTSNCDAAVAKVKQLGGQPRRDPVTLENVGRLAVLRDQQGATFAIFQPQSH